MKTQVAKPRFKDKYRALTFEELFGVQDALPMFEGVVANGTYNGMTFIGRPGMGKSTVARLLLARFHCSNPDGINPCGVCFSCGCHLIDGFSEWSLSVVSGGAITNQLMQKLEREMIGRFWMFGEYGCLIDDVDQMQPQQIRQLVKLLNDFPRHPLLFTAATLDPLPRPAIHRLQIVNLDDPPPEEVKLFAERICNIEDIRIGDPNAINALIERADGNYRSILNILEVLKNCRLDLTSENLMFNQVIANSGLVVRRTPLITSR